MFRGIFGQTGESKLRLGFGLALLLVSATSFCMAQQRPQQPQQPVSRENPYRNQAQTTALDQRQKHIDSYLGTISEKHKKFYLQVAYTKSSFELADTRVTKPFLNKKVRVTGWLDAEHEILHVTAIAKTP